MIKYIQNITSFFNHAVSYENNSPLLIRATNDLQLRYTNTIKNVNTFLDNESLLLITLQYIMCICVRYRIM